VAGAGEIETLRNEAAFAGTRRGDELRLEARRPCGHPRAPADDEAPTAESRGARPPIARHHGAIDESERFALPAGGERRQRRKEQEPVAASLFGGLVARIADDLPGVDDGAAGGVGNNERAVARAAVDDHDLADDALGGGGNERGKRVRQTDLIVMSLDDHGDHGAVNRLAVSEIRLRINAMNKPIICS